MKIDYDINDGNSIKLNCTHREAAAILAAVAVCADTGIKECQEILDSVNFAGPGGVKVVRKHSGPLDFFGKLKAKKEKEKELPELPDVEVEEDTKDAISAALDKFKTAGDKNESEEGPKEPKEE